MPATPSAETIATNTITIPNIPKEFFESPHVFEDLQNFLQVYGPLHTFVAIKGFARIMAVYEETQSAIEAKDELDKTQVLWRQTRDLTDVELVQFISDHDQQPISHSNDIHNFLLRLYFGQHTNINADSATVLLQVPELEKNWLISPPGSPPVGWQQIREEPPNTTVLPQDLSHALMSLSDELDDDFKLDADDEHESDTMSSDQATESSASSSAAVYVICKGDDHGDNGHEVPHITVQDWDGGAQHHNLEQYRRIHRKVAPTAMPPRPNNGQTPSLENRPPTPVHLGR
ncbi:Calcipressin-domain-containing protein [Umbelopsis sp. PMI_123]|nr:Calcipressin-domain-containing protein [Umbelopsis sp. PMI_123]